MYYVLIFLQILKPKYQVKQYLVYMYIALIRVNNALAIAIESGQLMLWSKVASYNVNTLLVTVKSVRR